MNAQNKIKLLSDFIWCIMVFRSLAARLRKREEMELRVFRLVHVQMSQPQPQRIVKTPIRDAAFQAVNDSHPDNSDNMNLGASHSKRAVQ